MVETLFVWSKSHSDLSPGSEVKLPVSFSIAKFQFSAPWDTAIAIRLIQTTAFKFGKSLSLSLPGKWTVPLGEYGMGQ